MKSPWFLILLFLLCGFAFADSPFVGSERNRNLRQLNYVPMLFELHEMTVGEKKQNFIFPKRNLNYRQMFMRSERNAFVHYFDSLGVGENKHEFFIAASPVFGIDYRGGESLNDTIWPGIDGGLFLRGFADSLYFDLDARIYAENHFAKKVQSFDHEVFDVQNESGNAYADYVSYARYRAHMGFDYEWFHAQVARDVLHVGPGYYNNLTLNQFALPYNMFSFDFNWGPFHVFSAYGDLRVDSWSYSENNLNDRNLYAHRYEFAYGNLTLAMNDVMILYNDAKLWMLVPVVPLFMDGGYYVGRMDNGALSFDFNYRLFGVSRIYGELFLDEMKSDRWAGTLGIQVGNDVTVSNKALQVGSLAEISRVQPFTYSVRDSSGTAMENLGLPIGNPNGSNSLAVDWIVYGRLSLGEFSYLYAGLHNKWLWKDECGNAYFIQNSSMKHVFSPSLNFQGQYVAFMGELSLDKEKAVYLRWSLMW